MLREHREWDRVQGAEGRAHLFQHTAGSGKDKQRLRIGYVSPDFRRHSVSYFFEPLLAQHDRALVEVTCYAEVTRGDAMTERLQGLSDHWCNTAGMSDAQLAQRIHADGIDILVDLAGHTANNRLRAFTFKPAPIQCSYLGYFTTTGLAAMDYWLTDEVLTPADTVEQSSETIYRLPRSCVVYQAPDAAPAVVERPAGGPVTFGSFNDLSKVSAEAVLRWCEILQRVPGSRLLIKARQLAGEEERRVWLGHFAAQGIGAERLILRSRTEGQAEHLAMYGEVDIALDAMPRTGGATTAEALWMGVPVISLAGERFIERLSATMLNAVGLDELVAATATDYVEKAVALAADDERRRALRQGLRARMAASPLCDARGLAHTFETAYRDMWQRWREA
jgi:predicted O-linked N-acetylglucosamine transferase (SPINDLY family)